jgi:hypothetical protein
LAASAEEAALPNKYEFTTISGDGFRDARKLPIMLGSEFDETFHGKY